MKRFRLLTLLALLMTAVTGVWAQSATHEYVDLGLPSGTLWATCNMGADSPEQYGDRYAWGETETKSYYEWSNYLLNVGSGTHNILKYCSDDKWGYDGFTDGLTRLLPEDDAATVNWGEEWRMPTQDDFRELVANTTQESATIGSIKGMKFISKTDPNVYIFLPYNGQYEGDLFDVNKMGHYWSSDGTHKGGYQFRIQDTNWTDTETGAGRAAGMCIRPVTFALPQDAAGNYLVGNVTQWKLFAKLVAETTDPVNVKMTADIDLGDDQTMIGSEEHPFTGVFNGKGHTLTVAYDATEDWVAPFRVISGATIKNLHVAGTVNNTQQHAAGIAGNVIAGTNYITNCISSVDITGNNTTAESSEYTDWNGGIAGLVINNGTSLYINDCMFNGSITSTSSGESMCANMVGLLVGGGKAHITNCLSTATFTGVYQVNSMYHYIFGSGTTTNSYVLQGGTTTDHGTAGTVTNAEALSDGTIAEALQAGRSETTWVQDATLGTPMLATFADGVYKPTVNLTFDPVPDGSIAIIVDGTDMTGDFDENGALKDLNPGDDVKITPSEDYRLKNLWVSKKSTWYNINYTNSNTWSGSSQDIETSWAVKYSPEVLSIGKYLTKVELASRGTTPLTMKIYSGGDIPGEGELIHTQVYQTPEAQYFFDFDLEEPLAIDQTKNLWLVFTQVSAFAAYAGKDPVDGNPDGSWIKTNGSWTTNSSLTWVVYALLEDLINVPVAEDGSATFQIPERESTTIYYALEPNSLDITFDPAPVQNMTVTTKVGDDDPIEATAEQLEAGKIEDVKAGTKVKLTAKPGYKFIKVTAKEEK